MAINSTFYLDAADLTSAVSVYLDSGLNNLAPDGYYGDGTVIRQQSSGILLTAEACVTCPTPCGTSIGGSGGQGIYLVNLDTGSTSSDVGAIVIKFNPQGVPDGIRATYGGVIYNKLSSPVDGLHQSTTYGNFTVVGNASSDCGMQGNTTTFPALSEFLFDGINFTPTGTTQSVTVLPGDVSLGGFPGFCVMVIPKTTASPSNVFLEMLGPCGGTAWNMSAVCPVLLPSFSASEGYDGTMSCSVPLVNTFYFAKVHTASDTYVGLYDYVFLDPYGEFYPVDGYYLTDNVASPNKVIQIENGIVIAITDCNTPPLPVTGLTWATTVDNPCDATPWVISNQNLKIRYNITNSLNCGGTCDVTQSGTATATITVGAVDVIMGLSFNGIGELQDADFEKITFSLDGTIIANANAAGGGLGCATGPVIQTYTTPPPYLLLAGTVHTLFIDFTTNDGFYHFGSFYEIDLTFTENP